MGHVLEVDGLTKRYPSFVLDDVSFSLPEGCIAGFIGANGAGKTTTIRSILNLARKDGGEIRVFGMDVDDHEREIKDRIGVVMGGSYFYGDLSMAEMKSVLAPAYTDWSDVDYRMYMDRFELDPKQRISTLSSGMKMKFSLALALSHKAELLIMDEPTSGLDPLMRSRFLEIVMDYRKEGGKGVFLSTHITSDLDKVADVLILINGGRIVFQRDKDDLVEAFRVVKGNLASLDERSAGFLMNLRLTPYGFTAVTDRPAEVKKAMPDVLLERAAIEDIMLAYIGGDGDDREPR